MTCPAVVVVGFAAAISLLLTTAGCTSSNNLVGAADSGEDATGKNGKITSGAGTGVDAGDGKDPQTEHPSSLDGGPDGAFCCADDTEAADAAIDGSYASLNCPNVPCGEGKICVEALFESGNFLPPPEGGTCPGGTALGDAGKCESLPTYKCKTLPAACASTVTCGCAQPVCDANYLCQSVTTSMVFCALLSP